MCQLTNLAFRSILRARQKVLLVIRIGLDVFDFLFAVEHLPALDAHDFSVTFRFDFDQLGDKRGPLW